MTTRREHGPITSARIEHATSRTNTAQSCRALAVTDRALEVNTRLPLDPLIVTWWREEGGTTVAFGSDVHDAHFLAQGFDAAVATVEANGFGPDVTRNRFWTLR